MIEETCRPIYEQIFITPWLERLSLRYQPIQFTLLSGLMGLFFIPALLFGWPLLAICFLLLSGYCDTLDGALARYQGTSSAIGTVADIVIDRLVEFAVVFAFYLQNPGHHSLATMLMLGSILLCVTSFLVVAIFSQNQSAKSFHYSPGLIERPEAFIFFIFMALFPGYFNYLALIFVILVLITVVTRLSQFLYAQQLIEDT